MAPEFMNVRNSIVVAAMAVLAVLLLAQLGRYTLWDDEGETALLAEGVLKTGDTSVRLDHGNLMAYRGGLVVHNFCDRSTPPLPIYVTAASFALFGVNAWAARLPFALAGLGTALLLLLWARRQSLLFLGVLALGLIGNVSLILFCRQSRYYALAVLFATALVLLYARAGRTPRQLLALSALSALLFACQYMVFIAVYACLVVDYLFWRRKEWPLTWRDALYLFAPQAVCNAVIGYVWNPLATQFGKYEAHSDIFDRLTILFWNLRDLNAAECLSLPLLVLALVLGVAWRQTWLVRGCTAVAVYIFVVSLISPQQVALTFVADIRYAVPLIPLAIVLEAAAICLLLGRLPLLAVGAAVVVFGTNFFNGGPLLDRGLRSTLCDYVGELLHPVPEPYTPTADWINANVLEGASIWVLPDYSTYPLMFRAPRALYAWQLDWPPRADFAGLPAIQFKGLEPPDYLVAFGPSVRVMAQQLQAWDRPEVHYNEVATIPVFWRDMYRPELFWRTFTPITKFNPDSEAVYIFKRTAPPVAAAAKP
ncbi:MAG TPA: glycosyltransferase family 39 protein [Candidatus Methylacidiphilales bacterium]|nr:glycosyltransferase family 39 protein [Candidatus Methylacidiphilales bacterium]